MELSEGYRSFPIKIYQNEDKYEYENSFLHGEADTLNNLFAKLSKKDFTWDLFYYYDDVLDVQLGTFEPALTDRKYKGRLYLGKINLKMDINNFYSTNTVKYISKNPEMKESQEEFIQKLKAQAKREEFLKSIKLGLVKLINMFKGE